MHPTQPKVWKHLLQRLETTLQVLQVLLLALLDDGEDDIGLPTLLDLFADPLVERGELVVIFM